MNATATPAHTNPLLDLIRDDAYAASFQSLGQYRRALVAAAPDHVADPGKEALRALVAACYQLDAEADECSYQDCASEVAPTDSWAEMRDALEVANAALGGRRQAAQVEPPFEWPLLDAPALIGGAIVGKGCSTGHVVMIAKRAYQYAVETSPEEHAAREKAFSDVLAQIHEGIAHGAPEDLFIQQEEKNEPLPCPFCGGQDAFVERADFSSAYVRCTSMIDEHSCCMAQGPIGSQEDDGEEIPGAAAAIEEWNRRASPDHIADISNMVSPAVQGEPVGEVRLELGVPSAVYAELYSVTLPPLVPGTKLYAGPYPAPDASALMEALEQCIASMLDSGYRADAVVIRAARSALAAHSSRGGET